MFKLINCCDGFFSSLDVRFTKLCDNNCKFCIEKTGIQSLGDTNPNTLVFSAIKTGMKDMLILGGEPFLLPDKLLNFVLGVREQFNTIYITTSLPNTWNTQRETCLKILDSIDGLNVSVQSVDSEENNTIYRASSKHDRIKILEALNNGRADKIRTCLNLVRGGIDTKSKLTESLNVLAEIGCKNIKINELQDAVDDYVSYEKIMGIKMKSPYSYGCYLNIEPYKNMNIVLKRSCFVTESTLKASTTDLIKIVYKAMFYKPKNRFMVLYEDGSIHNTWERR